MGKKFLILIIVVGLAFVFVGKYFQTTKNNIVEQTKKSEIVLKQIKINGLKNLKGEELVKSLPIKIGQAMIEINIKELQEKIKENPWVKDVSIFANYPNIIEINIVEKTPVGKINKQGDFYLIDINGDELAKEDEKNPKNLPVFFVDENKKSIEGIIKEMEKQPYFYDNWAKAILVGDRRFDIYLKSGMKIMLPKENVSLALERLNELRLKGDLLEYKIDYVDLRFEKKLIIKGI